MALTDNLVAYYKLSSTSDELGTYNLTNTGSVAFSTPGKIGNAAQFTASNTKALRSGSNMGYSTSGTMTWNFWVYVNTFAGDYVFDTETTTGSNRRILVYQSGSTVRAWFASAEIASSSMSTGTWYMITLVFSGTGANQCAFYLNGSSQGTTTMGAIAGGSRNEMSFGNPIDGLTSELDGAIDEAGVWTRALTGSEITELYNGGTGLTYPFLSFNPSPMIHMMQITGGNM